MGTSIEKIMDGVPLKERRERFCGHFIMTRNPMQAYRLAFVVDKTKTSQWVFDQAQRLMQDPDILARVQELRDTAAAQTLVSVRDLLQDWHDIATADPNEIVSLSLDACRFCHGNEHHYQWVNMEEFANAMDVALKQSQPMPDMSGGFGYTPTAEPVPTCPGCFGRGLGTMLAHDTRKLSPQARKLYKGVRKTPNSLEILLHDQEQARQSLAKVLGAFKEGGIPVTPAVPKPEQISAEATQEQAAKTYLRLVSSS